MDTPFIYLTNLNDTHMEKKKNSLKYKVAASDIFHMFAQSIKLF